jgi:hypothetical protein
MLLLNSTNDTRIADQRVYYSALAMNFRADIPGMKK